MEQVEHSSRVAALALAVTDNLAQDGHTVLLGQVLVEQGTLSQFSCMHRVICIDVVVKHGQLCIAVVRLGTEDVRIKCQSLLLLVVLVEGVGIKTAVVLVVGIFIGQLLHLCNGSLLITHLRV